MDMKEKKVKKEFVVTTNNDECPYCGVIGSHWCPFIFRHLGMSQPEPSVLPASAGKTRESQINERRIK